MYLKPGDTIEWECEQTNDGIGENGATFIPRRRFTKQVYTGEMCNLFGLYAPTIRAAVESEAIQARAHELAGGSRRKTPQRARHGCWNSSSRVLEKSAL